MANISKINGYDIKDAKARAKTDGHVVTDGTTGYTFADFSYGLSPFGVI